MSGWPVWTGIQLLHNPSRSPLGVFGTSEELQRSLDRVLVSYHRPGPMDEAWSRTQNRVHPTHGGTSTSCIMRIQRSVTHTCVWAEVWGPAKRKQIYLAGRAGRTPLLARITTPTPPDRNSPANFRGKTKTHKNTRRNVVITGRDTQRIDDYYTTFFFFSQATRASPPPRFCPAQPSVRPRTTAVAP